MIIKMTNADKHYNCQNGLRVNSYICIPVLKRRPIYH